MHHETQLRKVDLFDSIPYCGHCGGSIVVTLTTPTEHVLTCIRCNRTATISEESAP